MGIILDWKIRSRNPQCEHTGKDFVDGEEFYTCIFEDTEADGFVRRDFSASVWDEVKKKLDPKPFSRWKSVFEVPVVKSDADTIQDNSAEGMLRRMLDEDDSKTENTRYILAVMLERKKTLLPVDVKETETRRLLFYEHKDSGDVFIVADPQLKLDEIESIQAEVALQLNHEESEKSREREEVSEELPENDADSAGDNEKDSPDTEHEAVGNAG